MTFRLTVDPDPRDRAVGSFAIRIVCLGSAAEASGVEAGARVQIAGALTERRWRRPGGTYEQRFEVLARTLRVL
jgi:hypothetical protein